MKHVYDECTLHQSLLRIRLPYGAPLEAMYGPGENNFIIQEMLYRMAVDGQRLRRPTSLGPIGWMESKSLYYVLKVGCLVGDDPAELMAEFRVQTIFRVFREFLRELPVPLLLQTREYLVPGALDRLLEHWYYTAKLVGTHVCDPDWMDSVPQPIRINIVEPLLQMTPHARRLTLDLMCVLQQVCTPGLWQYPKKGRLRRISKYFTSSLMFGKAISIKSYNSKQTDAASDKLMDEKAFESLVMYLIVHSTDLLGIPRRTLFLHGLPAYTNGHDELVVILSPNPGLQNRLDIKVLKDSIAPPTETTEKEKPQVADEAYPYSGCFDWLMSYLGCGP